MKRILMLGSATLLGVALLGGCKNTDPTTGTTTLSGQVVTYKENKPVPKPWVQVYHQTRMGGYLAQGQPCQGDAQGHFSCAFTATDDFGYIALATADPGYDTPWGLGAQLKAGRANEGVVIPVYAPAWYKIQLVNTSKQKPRSIIIDGYVGSALGGLGDEFTNLKDTTIFRKTSVDYQPKSVFWLLTATDGTTSKGKQDTNPAPLDTVLVRIPF